MKVCGIIAEYNPFHNGHRYQIEQARKLSGCDMVIAVMSGNFVQRGDVAILDKHTRTKIALENGADLVILLPTFFCTQVAPIFASGSISLLNMLNCVDYICFGSESGDIEKLKSEVKEKIKSSEDKNISMQIPVAISEPTIKESQLQVINGIIAEYRSRYDTSNAERAYNVALTAQKLDKQLLMPGQEISFMNTLGDISIQSGFKTSKIIVNNEYQDGVGGGVCQVSSTLYNALLMSGIDIIQRTNHSFPVGYVPTGRDATVAIGGPDLKFRNNYDFPIFVKTYAYNGVTVADIYGDTTKATRYDVFSEITKTIEPTVIYKDDPTLPKGKEVVEDFGHTGYTAVSYKIANGKKTQISTDSYTMTPKIIKKGTGAPIEPEKKEDKKETTQVEKNQTQTTQKVKTTEPKKETNEASIVF